MNLFLNDTARPALAGLRKMYMSQLIKKIYCEMIL